VRSCSISAQVGHAGPVGQRRITGARPLAASSGFSPLGTRYHAMTAADIARVTSDFAAAARVVAEAGFDAVELHMGHHYLLNSFLSRSSTGAATAGAAASRTGPGSPGRWPRRYGTP
jgi:2,4-dienoyl-CoA reductase-like NADH-dependent reductase (Old Yellow Enzyme family)